MIETTIGVREFCDDETSERYQRLLSFAVEMTGTDVASVQICEGTGGPVFVCTAKNKVNEDALAAAVGRVVVAAMDRTSRLRAIRRRLLVKWLMLRAAKYDKQWKAELRVSNIGESERYWRWADYCYQTADRIEAMR